MGASPTQFSIRWILSLNRLSQKWGQVHNERAIELISAQRWADARVILEHAIRKMPNGWKPVQFENVRQSPVGEFLPVAFWDNDEFLAYSGNSDCMQQADKNIQSVPGSYSKAWYLLANVAVEQGRLKDALACVEHALELEPDHPRLWIQKGFIMNRLKHHVEALECYRQAAIVRGWAPKWQIARAYRGQGATLIDLGRLDEAEAAFLLSQELQPDNDVAKKELDFIRKTQATARIQNSRSTLRFQESPYDPLTIKLRSEVENLEPIPGPKTVGPENYSRILKAFMEHGWPGFEEMFDQIVPQTRPDYVKVKRDLLREPAFGLGTQQNAARLAEVWATESDPEKRKAAIKAAIEKIQRNSRKS